MHDIWSEFAELCLRLRLQSGCSTFLLSSLEFTEYTLSFNTTVIYKITPAHLSANY